MMNRKALIVGAAVVAVALVFYVQSRATTTRALEQGLPPSDVPPEVIGNADQGQATSTQEWTSEREWKLFNPDTESGWF